jgi:formate dehydrogenase maturation protein FdhE
VRRRPEEPPAVWTTETLRVHLERLLAERSHRVESLMAEKNLRDQQRFEAQEKALADALLAVEKSTQATFVAADRATTKAEMAADERFKAVNAFRDQLNDLIATFMPRAEAASTIGALTARMEAAAKSISERMDRMNQEVDGLASRIDKTEGRSGGYTASGALLVTVVGVVATVLTIVIAIGAWT